MVLPLHQRLPQSRVAWCVAWCCQKCTSRKLKLCIFSVIPILSCIWIWFLFKVLIYHIHPSTSFHFGRRYQGGFVAPKSKWTIFYHIYIPATAHKNALRIVHEQLKQVEDALSSGSPEMTPVTLYYTTVGDWVNALGEWNLQSCRSTSLLNCQHWQHVPQASESETLQTIYDFCQRHDPGHVVTYIHSKGSFHRHKVNERWRYYLTSAALHRDCVSNTMNNQCNVCGLHFYTQWTNFFPGNMWTARCGYIRAMIPPNDFSERQETTIANLLWLRHRGMLESHLFIDRLDRFGLERYSTEHWIGSHPNIEPCDMAPSPLRDWLTGTADIQQFSWSSAPRQEGAPADNPPSDLIELLQTNRTARQKELFYLPGRIFVWQSLYGSLPPNNSWIWAWFPDGPFWKKHFQTEGYDHVRSKDLYKLPQNISAGLAHKLIEKDSAQITCFLLVEASEPNSSKIRSQVERLVSLTSQYQDIRLVYQVAGEFRMETVDQIEAMSLPPQFQPLPQSLHASEGHILSLLFEHCRESSSPEELVMFMSTTEVDPLGNLVDCVDSIKSGGCNICGDKLYTGPLMQFSQRYWISPCSYVRKLVSPGDYGLGMNQVVSRVWVETLKDRFVGVPDSESCLGLDMHSLKSWVTSHPEVEPCKVPSAPVEDPYCSQSHQPWNTERGKRIRSYSLLAGHLFRWYSIYGKIPSTSSWIWSVFPDSDDWKSAAARGMAGNVVESVTKVFADTTV